MKSGQSNEGTVFLEFIIDEKKCGEDVAISGIIRVPIVADLLSPEQRNELYLHKNNNESMTQMRVDLVEYAYEGAQPQWQRQLVTEIAKDNDCEKESVQALVRDYLAQRADFRRLKQKEHEEMRQKFKRIPVESLVCYSDSIGVGPYVRVPLGAENGEATLNRKILNEMRPYFTDTAVFLAKFQQARLVAENHNEALAEKLQALWAADGLSRQEDKNKEQHYFGDVELVVEFDGEFKVA